MQPRSFILTDTPFVTPIVCPDCGGKAHLMSIRPVTKATKTRKASAAERRTFECADCGREIELSTGR
jgi:DNA-directed RNA polymerase subunit RPC12/RpoP